MKQMVNKLIEQSSDTIDDLDATLRALQDAREEQVKLSSYADNANEKMMEIHRDKTLHYGRIEAETIASPDPRTGRTNKEWSEMLLDQFLEQDPEYMTAVGELYKAKEALAEINQKVLNLSDAIHNYRTEARLLAAMLGVFQGEG